MLTLRILLGAVVALLITAQGAAAQRNAREVLGKECRISTDVPQADAEEVAKRIDEFCGVFAGFYDGLGMQARQTSTIVVRLFANADDFHEFRERDGANVLGMYSSESLNAIVAYHAPYDASASARLFGLCSNMYMRRYCAESPAWVRRGFQAFFSGYTLEPGKPPIRELPMVHLSVLQEALTRGEYVPLGDLVKRNRQTFEDRLPKGTKMHNLLAEAEGWGLVHYLLVLAPEAEQEMFRTFLKSINAKGAKADKAELPIRDWKEFEARWAKAMLAIPSPIDTAEEHMQVADGHMEVLNYSFAIPEYRTALKMKRNLPGLRYKFGFALKRGGYYDEAIQRLDEAVLEDPSSALPHYQLTRIYLGIDSKGKFTPVPVKALEHAQETVKLDGGDRPAYLELLARSQALGGDRKAALSTARKALAAADKDEKDVYEKLVKEIQKGG